MAGLKIAAAATRHGQTPVPAVIRSSSDVSDAGGAVLGRLLDSGQVTVARRPYAGEPAVGAFLSFIGTDFEANPQRLRPLTAGWLAEIGGLVEGVACKLGEELDEQDE